MDNKTFIGEYNMFLFILSDSKMILRIILYEENLFKRKYTLISDNELLKLLV